MFILDPEDEETEEERNKRIKVENSKATSEKISENIYFIPDPEHFEDKADRCKISSTSQLGWSVSISRNCRGPHRNSTAHKKSSREQACDDKGSG